MTAQRDAVEAAPATVPDPGAGAGSDGPAAGRATARRAGQERPGPASSTAGTWSAEVQALRALAVLLVVAYHLWPDAVPGGYVGVDVFFVISGFLISGHILRDLERGRFTLVGFYARRARRLLPAALLVLLVVAVGVVALRPRTQWVPGAQQVLASAAYAQNWVLAFSDVDYLNPSRTPTAVQHFWSLSVEEQFYLFWPVLLMAATAVAVHLPARVRRAALGAVMAAVAGVSLLHGVRLTAAAPEEAYFVTTTRVWEFAAGALLALVWRPVTARPAARAVLAWAGLAAVAVAAFAFTDRTPFPGTAALLPVAGALAFVASGRADAPWSPGPVVRTRTVQLFGDISYSLYLWHWPVIVLLPGALGVGALSLPQTVAVLAVTVLVSWLSWRHVENRFRAPRPGPVPAQPARRHGPRLLPAVAGLTAAVVVVAGGAWLSVERRVARAETFAAEAIAVGRSCFGAAGLEAGCRPPYGPDVVVPDPAGALADFTDTPFQRHCLQDNVRAAVVACSLGDPRAGTHVVLFGDSHALQWAPALEPLLEQRGWRMTTLLRAACTPNEAVTIRPTPREQQRCNRWARAAVDRIVADEDVDLVLTTALDNKTWRADGAGTGYAAGVRGYRRTWERFLREGSRVVVLRDTPRPLSRTRDCVAEDPTGTTCARNRTGATDPGGRGRPDPMAQAARDAADPRITWVDLTDAFCGPEVCPPVVGNVLVYADGNHITPTYARTLAPRLGSALEAALTVPADRAGA